MSQNYDGAHWASRRQNTVLIRRQHGAEHGPDMSHELIQRQRQRQRQEREWCYSHTINRYTDSAAVRIIRRELSEKLSDCFSPNVDTGLEVKAGICYLCFGLIVRLLAGP